MADDAENTQDLDSYAPRASTAARFMQVASGQGVVRITLNRPPANVLSVDLMEELNSMLESLEYQRDVKLVVLAAAGKYFSAGFELGDHLGDRAYLMMESFKRLFENLAKLDKPVLAVVAGPALGAGSILAATSCWPAPAPSSATRRSRAACSTPWRPRCCRGSSAASGPST